MEVCDIVGKSVNLLLSRTMSSELSVPEHSLLDIVLCVCAAGCLSRLVHSEGLTIPQLGQVWVNIDHLANSISQLEKFIISVVTK